MNVEGDIDTGTERLASIRVPVKGGRCCRKTHREVIAVAGSNAQRPISPAAETGTIPKHPTVAEQGAKEAGALSLVAVVSRISTTASIICKSAQNLAALAIGAVRIGSHGATLGFEPSDPRTQPLNRPREPTTLTVSFEPSEETCAIAVGATNSGLSLFELISLAGDRPVRFRLPAVPIVVSATVDRHQAGLEGRTNPGLSRGSPGRKEATDENEYGDVFHLRSSLQPSRGR